MSRTALRAAAALLVLPVLAACTSADPSTSTPITVKGSAGACDVTPTSVAQGSVTITGTWEGEGVGEVYLYASQDGEFTQILGEVEDLTTTPKSFTADVTKGTYEIKCEGGGQEVRTTLTVTS